MPYSIETGVQSGCKLDNLHQGQTPCWCNSRSVHVGTALTWATRQHFAVVNQYCGCCIPRRWTSLVSSSSIGCCRLHWCCRCPQQSAVLPCGCMQELNARVWTAVKPWQ